MINNCPCFKPYPRPCPQIWTNPAFCAPPFGYFYPNQPCFPNQPNFCPPACSCPNDCINFSVPKGAIYFLAGFCFNKFYNF